MSQTVRNAKILLAIPFLAVFLASATLPAYHHHTQGHSSLNDCSICYSSHHTSTALSDTPNGIVEYTGLTFFEPARPTTTPFVSSACLQLPNYRAPPVHSPA